MHFQLCHLHIIIFWLLFLCWNFLFSKFVSRKLMVACWNIYLKTVLNPWQMISRFFVSWCEHIMFNLTEVFTFLALGMMSELWLCYKYLEYDCILDHIPDFFGGSLLLCCCYNTRWLCMCFFSFLLSTPDTALAKMECWLPPPTCRWVRCTFSFPHCTAVSFPVKLWHQLAVISIKNYIELLYYREHHKPLEM